MNLIQERKIDSIGRPSTLNFNQEQAILCLYKHGFKALDIAKFFSLTTAAVYYHFKKFRISNIEKYTKPDIEYVLKQEGYL